MAPHVIPTSRRLRRRMPRLEQPPADVGELSSQLEICHCILRHGSKRQGPSVHGGDGKPKTDRKRPLRHPERAQFRAEFIARHPPMISDDTMTIKPKNGVTLLS